MDSLSNYFGSTGVYVFRPQPGQNGYVEGSERATVGNAFLSAESGRTSIGSADPNAGLAQGALTFSDGTNSGIVISDVSSAQNGSMTFSVTIPQADPQTLWQGYCASGRMFGDPKVAVTSQGQVYLAFRDVTNNNELLIYQAQDGGFSRLASPGSASSYDLAAGSNGLLAALGGETPVLKQLDGDTWNDLAKLDRAAHEPRLAFGTDTTFLLAAPNGASAKDLQVYQLVNGTFTPIGERVDKGGSNATLTVFGDRLFTSYRMDGKAMIRFNAPDVTDSLLSISVTPPSLTSCHQGDEVSTQGLRVFANYASGPRELSSREYTLTGTR